MHPGPYILNSTVYTLRLYLHPIFADSPAGRRYDFFLASPLLGATQYETEFDFGGTHVFVSTCVVEGLRCFFIEPQNGFFATDSVYGRKDDGMRFEFFCKVRRALQPRAARGPT